MWLFSAMFSTVKSSPTLLITSDAAALASASNCASAKAGASARRVHDVLGSTDMIAAPAEPRPVAAIGEVRFDAVHFGYDCRPVLTGFDLTLRPGETVCLIGPSGAGDVRALDPAALRRLIAFVPQDPWLLDATVADNIAFGTPQATWHGIVHAARLTRVEEFLERLPYGYDTVLGAGKGHETGQEVDGVKHPFDDRVVLRAAIEAR